MPSPQHRITCIVALLVASTAAAQTFETDTFRFVNGIPTEVLYNAILANPEANALLAKCPLRDETFRLGSTCAGNVLAQQLHDPYAQLFMAKLVEGMLPEGAVVKWTDPYDSSITITFAGQYRFCEDWGDENWQNMTLEHRIECLEIASAFLVQVNNPLAARVALDLVGEHQSKTDAYQERRSIPDTDRGGKVGELYTIASFNPCPSLDCGWGRGEVGLCLPGKQVTLDASVLGSPLPCNPKPEVELRVCEGVSGCKASDAIGETKAPATCESQQAVSFTCPDETKAHPGLFSVMMKVK